MTIKEHIKAIRRKIGIWLICSDKGLMYASQEQNRWLEETICVNCGKNPYFRKIDKSRLSPRAKRYIHGPKIDISNFIPKEL